MMARSASADIMCVGSKCVREKFTGIIRYAILTPSKLSIVAFRGSDFSNCEKKGRKKRIGGIVVINCRYRMLRVSSSSG